MSSGGGASRGGGSRDGGNGGDLSDGGGRRDGGASRDGSSSDRGGSSRDGGSAPGTPAHEVVGLIVDSDEHVGGGGFLQIRRLRLRNRRADGSASAPYVCDSVARPYGQDAVVAAIYAWPPAAGTAVPAGAPDARPPAADAGVSAGSPTARLDSIRVLVREGLRPALSFGRAPDLAPLPEPAPTLFLTELVAGIIEAGDRGEEGLRVRASHEIAEEAGFAVDPSSIVLLGAGSYPSPGSMIEKFYFVAAEVDPAAQQPLADGDGSPMEEGARTRWLGLGDAIAACERGEIPDLKTELGLRRLRDHLARSGG